MIQRFARGLIAAGCLVVPAPAPNAQPAPETASAPPVLRVEHPAERRSDVNWPFGGGPGLLYEGLKVSFTFTY